MQVTVTVKLFASLRVNRFKVETRTYEDGITIEKIAADLNIPKEELALKLVNGQDAMLNHKLNDGDILSLFPAVGGG